MAYHIALRERLFRAPTLRPWDGDAATAAHDIASFLAIECASGGVHQFLRELSRSAGLEDDALLEAFRGCYMEAGAIDREER